MNAPSEAFLQTTAFASLTLANAHADAAGLADSAEAPPARLNAERLQATPGLAARLVRGLILRPAPLTLEGGVGIAQLQRDLQALLEGKDPLNALLRPAASALASGAGTLPLPPVPAMLLTAARWHQPGAYQHAVRAMALAGGLAWHAGAHGEFLHQALLVGLLHDIGELYVDAPYLRATGRQLDLAEYRQLAAHPQVGALLLDQLTSLPPEIARAVREHHERLDGTGYPYQRLAPALSPLGQLMAVAELVLGIVDADPQVSPHAAQRASFALRFVPGELAGQWAGPVTHWAEAGPAADLDLVASDAALAQLGPLEAALPALQHTAESLAARLDGAAQRVTLRAAHRLQRLRMAWNAMGLWSLDPSAIEPQERFELGLAMRELRYRLSSIGRDSLWPERDLAVQADPRLVPLWLALSRACQAPR